MIEIMRDVPREHIESMPDVYHFLRRVTGRLVAIRGRLEVVDQPSIPQRRERLPVRPAADPRTVADASFKPAALPAPVREQCREITAARGRRVRVVERGCPGQLRMDL